MKTISIILPTYNRKERLAKALDSVLSQEKGDCPLFEFEVLVVDDGSTDGTEEMLRRGGFKTRPYLPIKYFKQENQGPSAARNLGIRKAQGEWLAFLDSDDEWLPGKLKAQIEFMDQNPVIKILQTEEIWIRNGRRVNPMKKHRKYGGWIFEQCLPLCIISPSAVMIHRSVFADVGLFDESYPACEDYELWLRIAAKYPVGLISKPFIRKFGGHEDQLSHKYEAMDQFRIRALTKILQSGTLTPEQTTAAKKVLEEKGRIFSEGAKKRGHPPQVSVPFFSQKILLNAQPRKNT